MEPRDGAGVMEPVLSFRHLTVAYRGARGMTAAVRDVSLDLHADETVGLIGESGSGKTTLALAALRLLPPAAEITAGQVLLHGRGGSTDLASLPQSALRRVRGGRVAMVFQSALNALNPILRVREHFADTARAHGLRHPAEIRARTLDLLLRVQLDPDRVLTAFPHELSGGMRQRVMLALALLLRPRVVILDEPTTALDILTQRTIIDLLRRLRRELGFALLFISHDLSLAAELADRVATMYAGRIVEIGDVDRLFYHPRHPYTQGLLEAVPTVHGDGRDLRSIPGAPADPSSLPSGCPFHPRCAYAQAICVEQDPPLFAVTDGVDGHRSACHFWDRVRRRGVEETA